MGECLRLAEKGAGRVSPNPMVGAVLVKDGRVIARGYHHRFGGSHAEADCLRKAAGRARGATLYVNLEPCSHYGKTPPCTDLIIRSGIQRVVVGMRDPNPIVDGRGIRRLRAAGVQVTLGVLGEQAAHLNRAFTTHITHGRPYIHVKIAQSADGFIAGTGSRPRWISSLAARRLVHRWRSTSDAVLVGAGTIRSDDPRLTTRLVRGRDPDAIILDGRLSIPLRAKVLTASRKRRVIVCTSTRAVKRNAGKAKVLAARGVLVLSFEGEESSLRLRTVLRRLYRLGIGSVFVEGGREVFTTFLREGPMDETSLFLAPLVLGKGIRTLRDGAPVRDLFDAAHAAIQRVGSDLLIHTIWHER